MGQLLIGARHLHLPVLAAAPLFHGFLVLEYASGVQRVFSGDKDRGLLYRAPLLLYEDIFDQQHPDRRGLVVLRPISEDVDAGQLEAAFRDTRSRIEALDLTYALTLPLIWKLAGFSGREKGQRGRSWQPVLSK